MFQVRFFIIPFLTHGVEARQENERDTVYGSSWRASTRVLGVRRVEGERRDPGPGEVRIDDVDGDSSVPGRRQSQVVEVPDEAVHLDLQPREHVAERAAEPQPVTGPRRIGGQHRHVVNQTLCDTHAPNTLNTAVTIDSMR